MFVGHGFLAFAIAALVVHRLGDDELNRLVAGARDRRALIAGLIAGGFGLLPDVDMVYAPVGLLGGPDTLLGAADAFWAASTVTHRGLTHSLIVGILVAVVVFLWARGGRSRYAGGALGIGVVALPLLTGDALIDVTIMLTFVIGAAALATLATNQGLDPRVVGGLAALGLLSHPFGDVFTGTPPVFLYPFEATLLLDRVVLSADPTLHLLGAMGVELIALWVGLLAYAHVNGTSLRARIGPWAAGGMAYAGTAFIIPAPTLDLSYPFVFSVVGLGVVLAAPRTFKRDWLGTGLTFLTTVTLAALSYTLLYLAL